MPLFLSIGECMIELSSLGGDLMRKGFAGDTFNTLWYAGMYLPEDWNTAYLTALGDDAASREMKAFFEGAGVDTGFVREIPGATPGLYMIHLDNGERSFSYWRSAAAARQLADDPALLERAVAAADIVYFSGITLAILPDGGRRNLIAAAKSAREAGKLVAFDPNIRPRLWANKEEMLATITEGARTASLVMPGFDDEASHFGDASVEATVARYLSLGVDQVLVKDGGKGATIGTKDGNRHIPAAKVGEVVDTTAAGDSFNGGYLARIARGDAPAEAAGFAARVAAAVIRHPGALISRDKLGI